MFFPIGWIGFDGYTLGFRPLSCQTIGTRGIAVDKDCDSILSVEFVEGLIEHFYVIEVPPTGYKHTHKNIPCPPKPFRFLVTELQ
jgi:hypothetical protein